MKRSLPGNFRSTRIPMGGDTAAEIPRERISRRIIRGYRPDRQHFAISPEQYSQIRHATVVDVRVGMRFLPATVVGIRGPIRHDVVVNLFLKIDANGATGANRFVRADSRVGGNIAAGIGDSNVSSVETDVMVRACDRSRGEFLKEQLVNRSFVSTRGCQAKRDKPDGPKKQRGPSRMNG